MKKIARFAKATGQELKIKEGASHTRVWVGTEYTTVPRHSEIPNKLAAKIYKQVGME
ncbi:toxin HicA [Corynebacterium sp. TA-R-1]|uniref:Toxin HicA n=1 Tax=Corynebacterium stercoris TaxID=2943490 RepID=A0ABT1G4S0_9CORY|nr:toxin HicA [Corynebacterium stercoris]MCP1388655.1 toxin HicA [Corynebacterium stercoris]